MLLIEFESNLNCGLNILKYRNTTDDSWYYLYIDIETLSILLTNFGIISTLRMPTKPICIDIPETGKCIQMKFCDAPIELYCGNNAPFYLPILEQNY
jgi:hypothetical protein